MLKCWGFFFVGPGWALFFSDLTLRCHLHHKVTLWRNHHTCINDYLDFWVNTTVIQGTYNNRTNNDQCFISKVKLYVMRDPPWAALLTLWISLGMENEDKQQPQQSLYGLLATLEETCVCILQVASCFMLKEISTKQMFHISF